MLSILILLICVAAVWICSTLGEDKLRQYRDVLGLEKANLVYANDYQRVRDLVLPTRQTALKGGEPVIWLYRKDNSELFLGANRNGDIRIWLEAKTVLENVHIVLDSTSNNTMGSNLKKDQLPKQEIELEGTFPQYFKLYCNEGQQVIALQIIAPNIMAYLLDNLLYADIEIIDRQVAIIIRGGAKTLAQLEASIQFSREVEKMTAAVAKVVSL
jgi:hypothetical protein